MFAICFLIIRCCWILHTGLLDDCESWNHDINTISFETQVEPMLIPLFRINSLAMNESQRIFTLDFFFAIVYCILLCILSLISTQHQCIIYSWAYNQILYIMEMFYSYNPCFKPSWSNLQLDSQYIFEDWQLKSSIRFVLPNLGLFT